MGGEADRVRSKPASPGGDRDSAEAEPHGDFTLAGFLLHVVLLVPVVPGLILMGVVTLSTVGSLLNAIDSPSHAVVIDAGSAPVGVAKLAVFMLVLVLGLAVLIWTATLIATIDPSLPKWQAATVASLGMLLLGCAVLAFSDTPALAVLTLFAVYVYTALVAGAHWLWHRRAAVD